MLENTTFDITAFEEFLSQIPKVDIKPPAVTFGTVFKHEHKENFISDWLAYLLDSKNTGTNEPLSALIDIAHKEEKCNIDFSEVSIQREYVFPQCKRRIDFLITTPSHIIGIENKIWSGLQEKQLEDYSKQIKGFKKDIKDENNEMDTILILLCPDMNKVKYEISNDFKLVTYDALIEEFKKIRINCFENIRAAILMEDFISHVEEFFMNKTNNDFNLKFIQFQSQNQEKITELNENIEKSKKQFNQRFESEITNNGFADGWKVLPRGGKDYFMQIYKPSWNNGSTHFEFLTDGNFPPNKITVAFHIEGKNLPHNIELTNMKEDIKYDKIVIEMNYDTGENFENGVKKVIETLKNFDKKYTKNIDAIFAK